MMDAFLARLLDWRPTSKNAANVEIALTATGAFSRLKPSLAPSTSTKIAESPAATIATPKTHGPAPRSRSRITPSHMLFWGLFRRAARMRAAGSPPAPTATGVYILGSCWFLAIYASRAGYCRRTGEGG